MIRTRKLIRSSENKVWDWQSFPYAEYNDYEEISQFLHNVHEQFPNMTKIVKIGQSFEGRNLLAIKIGNGNSSIWIDAGIHAREWISVSTAINFIRMLLEKYYKNPEDDLTKHLSWYVLPILNPDGYQYSMNTDRLWRKSRSRSATIPDCPGVDLNRNFDFDFGRIGASDNPCSIVYRGPTSFSEPETRALRDFLKQNDDHIKAYVALHSFGQLWLIPFGHKVNSFPTNIAELRITANNAVKSVRSMYNTKYKTMSAADLYPASGDACDWISNNTNIKYSYTIELRPDTAQKGGFILPEKQIIPTANEAFVGLLTMAKGVVASEKAEKRKKLLNNQLKNTMEF